jgi:hypothetical protein
MTYVQYIGKTVNQEAPVGKAGIAGVFTVQPGELINVPADVAAYLIANESSKWQAASDPTQVSKHITVTSTSSVSAVASAGAGTSPPAPVVTSGSDDTKGQVTFGTGTSPAATSAQATVTYNTPYASTSVPRVIVGAANAATAALGPYAVEQGQTGFQIWLTTAPSASQANTVYAIKYHIIG